MRFPTPARWRMVDVRVIDGDTLEVIIDRGFDDTSMIHVRLKNVFAPERGQPGYVETRNFVYGWLLDHNDETDWPFIVETFRTPKSDVDVETIGRYVGVITSQYGANLNEDVQAFITQSGYPGGTGS